MWTLGHETRVETSKILLDIGNVSVHVSVWALLLNSNHKPIKNDRSSRDDVFSTHTKFSQGVRTAVFYNLRKSIKGIGLDIWRAWRLTGFQNLSTHVSEEEMKVEENRSKAVDTRLVTGNLCWCRWILQGILLWWWWFWCWWGGWESLLCSWPYTQAKLNVSFDVQYILTSYKMFLILKNNFCVVYTRKLKDMKY